MYLQLALGDMTAKCWNYRCHTKISHSIENLVLKLNTKFVPTRWQRSTKGLHIAHSLPGQKRRSGKVI
jgi:heterodisulfide reductase subunit B